MMLWSSELMISSGQPGQLIQMQYLCGFVASGAMWFARSYRDILSGCKRQIYFPLSRSIKLTEIDTLPGAKPYFTIADDHLH